MKKRAMFYSVIFVTAISAAFAGSRSRPSATSLSYKIDGETNSPCHTQTQTVSECGSGQNNCVITGLDTRRYFSDNACATILKKN